jgi:hypothetical protein
VIFLGHLLDENDRFRGYMRFMLVVFRFAMPVDPEKRAVPAEEGVGLHNEKSLLPELGKSRKWEVCSQNSKPGCIHFSRGSLLAQIGESAATPLSAD